jgi:hypothetical protein
MENQSTGREIWPTWPTVTWDKSSYAFNHADIKASDKRGSILSFLQYPLFIYFLLFFLFTEFFLRLIWVASYCCNYNFRVPYLFIYLFIYLLLICGEVWRKEIPWKMYWVGRDKVKVTGQHLCGSDQHSPGSGRECRTNVNRLKIFPFHKLRVITWTSQEMFF